MTHRSLTPAAADLAAFAAGAACAWAQFAMAIVVTKTVIKTG